MQMLHHAASQALTDLMFSTQVWLPSCLGPVHMYQQQQACRQLVTMRDAAFRAAKRASIETARGSLS